MCGIAGAVGSLDEEVGQAIARAGRAQSHRGPDAEGDWSATDAAGLGAAFVHRRLAILDLSEAGRQPMIDPETGHVVCFNGEIYNYRELRRELAARGQRFRTETDTEVLLKAYAVWGTSAIDRFRGMFAFALWDANRRETLLVRDRLGIKPLYLAELSRPGGRVLLFASEVRALLASGLVEARLDAVSVGTFLWNGFVVGPRTIVSGVRELPAGVFLVADANGAVVREETYWTLPRAGSGGSVEELEARLEEAVRIRLVSDVPLGIFLSGGIDSSAVAALAARSGAGRPRTFTVGFKESRWDESHHAAAVAKALGTEHTPIQLSPAVFGDQLDDALRSIDQPTFDAVNSYFVSRAVREAGLTVALSGAGGDEVFGGYRSFRDLPWSVSWARLLRPAPESLLSALTRLLTRLQRRRQLGEMAPQTRWGKIGDLLATRGHLVDAYQVAYALFTRDFLAELSSNAAAEGLSFGLPRARRDELGALGADEPILHAISLLELSLFLGERLLRDTDAASMAVSLEVRLPLIDHEVVEAAARLPEEQRFLPLGRKQVLRDAALRAIPHEIFDRPKMGFELPFDSWCRQDLRSRLEEAFSRPEAAEAVGLRPEAVRRLWRAFLAEQPGLYWSRVWSLFVLLEWAGTRKVTL